MVVNLFNDDATKVDWEILTDGRNIDCVVTDPPFGVEYQSRRGKTAEHDRINSAIANDASLDDAVPCFLDAINNMAHLFAEECEMYVFTRWDILPEWVEAVSRLSVIGFKYKALLVWDKGNLGMGDIDASWGASHEIILYLKKGRRDLNGQRSSVLHFDRPSFGSRIHPTEKPASLLEVLIKASTDKGDLVVDPFSGSASTLIAARSTGRDGVGTELDSKFFELANIRLGQESLFG